jgi:hypothetical protein
MALTFASAAEQFLAPRPMTLFMTLVMGFYDAFMTLPRYTRIREGEVHELGLGVRNCSRSTRSRPLSEPSESIERACEATSAEWTARCASRGKR